MATRLCTDTCRARRSWPDCTAERRLEFASPRRGGRASRSGLTRGKKRGERENADAKKGRWEVSVRDASLLGDNPRAGPVCFKSNQSIRINYPRAPTAPCRVARAGTRTRGGWGACVLCFPSLCTHTPRAHTHTLTQPPRLSEKEPIKIKL